jgi:hypothetical protein
VPDADARSTDRRWVLVALVVALPVLVLIGSLAQRTWYPTGDQAQAELRVRSLPQDPPLVGAAGRIQDDAGRQGNHPGPLMFWATWPLYELLGGSSWAFEAATALVNVAWLVVAVWLVARRAGIGASAWFGIGTLVLLGGYGLDVLSQPWNPWVALLPFTVLVLSTWSVLEGDRWLPLLAVAAGSYSLQGHIGYLPLVVPLVGVALGWPIVAWWRSHPRPGATSWGWPLLGAVLLGLALWSGPIIDVATNDPHNVSKLLANFGSPDEDPIGVGRAIEAILQSVNPAGPLVQGGAEVEGPVLPGLVLLLGWAVVAVLVAVRRAQPSLTRLNLVLAAVTVLGVLAVSRIFGSLYLYVFRWIVPIAALQLFALGWGLARLAPPPSAVAARRWATAAVVALVTLSIGTSVRLAGQEIPYDQSSRAESALAPAVAESLDPDQRYLVVWDDPAYLGGLGHGLILDLERRGFEVGGLAPYAAAIEPQRVLCPGEEDAVLTVVTGARNIERYRSNPAYRELAATDPREDPEAWDRSEAALLEALAADGRPMTAEELEAGLNFLALNEDQPDEIIDLAADLVLSGVPSAVFIQDPAPTRPPVERTPLEEPCWR